MPYRHVIRESISFAGHSLAANKLRTFLSLLGITIGIFAIITVFTIVDSLEDNIRKSVASLGDDVVFVNKWPWEFGSEYPWWKYLNRPVVKYAELPEITRHAKLAESAAFVAQVGRTVKYRSNSIENVQIICVSSGYDKVKTFEISEGRYFTDNEIAGGRAKAVIGYEVAMNLFQSTGCLGNKIKLQGRKIEVVGVFAREGSSAIGNSMDQSVVLPVTYARTLFELETDRVNPTIYIKAKKGVSKLAMKDEVTGILRNVRRLKPLADDNFALNETSMLSKGFDGLFMVIGLAGWVIGGFSVIVGGFGIANIMFVSVRERTSLIGIQKALGARNIFILLQFMVESVLLSLTGGILGLLLVFAGVLMINSFTDFGVVLSWANVLLALTISGLIGIISGFVPSYTASQLDPVEAMRSSG